MLFDTHAHYDDDQFDGDRETLLASLPEQGVGLVVNPGCTVASSRTAVERATRRATIFCAAWRRCCAASWPWPRSFSCR